MAREDKGLYVLTHNTDFLQWRRAIYGHACTKNAEAGMYNPQSDLFRADPMFRNITEVEWVNADSIVRGLILKYTCDALRRSLPERLSGWLMLHQLETQLAGGMQARQQLLLDQLNRLRAETNEGVRKYTTRTQQLQDRLRASRLGDDIAVRALSLQFFRGLPESLKAYGYSLQSRGVDIDTAAFELEQIEAGLLLDKRRNLGLGAPQVGAVDDRGGPGKVRRPGSTCYHCGQPGHFKRDCPRLRKRGGADGGRGGGNRAASGNLGHPVTGYPGDDRAGGEAGSSSRVPPPSSRPRNAPQCYAGATVMSIGDASGYSCILDSGTSAGHLCPDLDLFTPDSLYEVDITVGFGPHAHKITLAGDVIVNTNGGAGLMLMDALYCPNLPFTIVSKHRMAKSEGLVLRDAHGPADPAAFFDRATGELAFTAEPTGTGLWVLDLPMSVPLGTRLGDTPAYWPPEGWRPTATPLPADVDGVCAATFNAESITGGTAAPVSAIAAAPESAELWHRRLGHPGRQAIARTVRARAVTGVGLAPEALVLPNERPCEPCVMGKSHRHPMPTATGRPEGPSDTVVIDTSGKLPPGINGEIYAHLMLHIDSGYTLLAFATGKADIPTVVQEQLQEVERQTGRLVKIIRSDRGGEYVNYTLKDWLLATGIRHEMTLPYVPEQKGAGESTWRGLFERARALLFESALPAQYWPFAVGYANECRNALLTRGHSVTPLEQFTGRQPDLSVFKPFGCAAYAHLPKETRAPGSKLEPRAVKGIFLGFEEGAKGWQLLVGDDIIISRDVIFDELAGSLAAKLPPPALTEVPEEPELRPRVAEPRGGGDPDGQGSAQPGDSREDADASAGADDDISQPDDATEAPSAGPSIGSPSPRAPRARRPPAHLQDFVGVSTPSAGPDPSTFEEAVRRPDGHLWRDAMAKEILNMETNGAWEYAPLPHGAIAIPAKTVFKIKRTPMGEIDKYKARLVARGFVEGFVPDVYAPASHIATVRTFLAVAAARDYELGSLDVEGAFLKGELPPGTYIELPAYTRQFLSGAPASTGPVTVHLHKAMYGLKIAPKVWYETLAAALTKHGFKRAPLDPCLFTGAAPNGDLIYLLVYVDDVLVASKTKAAVAQGVGAVLTEFKGNDLGEPSAFLGLRIERDRTRREIKLSQERHVRELLARHGLEGCAPKATPLSTGHLLQAEGELLDGTVFPYLRLLGGLLYLATHTRPDIAFVLGALARYSQRPTTAHWAALKGVLRYLAGTADLRLHLGGCGADALQGWCDADWAGDLDSRRSTTGYLFTFGNGAITWASKRQGVVTMSTAEAEYTAASAAAREALWLRALLAQLGVETGPVPLYSDSQAAIAIAKSPGISARTKHIDVRLHFIRERAAAGDLELRFTPSGQMLADPLTKAVPEATLCKIRPMWGLR